MRRAIGITEFLAKEFITYDFEGAWKDCLGEPERNFTMCVYGSSGQGKTSFCIAFAKYLTQFTRVYYNTFEEGISKTIQDALRRYNMQEVAGKMVFGDMESVAEMDERMGRRGSPGVYFIDSRDYLNLTAAQFKRLRDKHPRKAIIVICWAKTGQPKGDYAKAIEYMCDIKVYVHDLVANPRSRFGGNVPFVIGKKRGRQVRRDLFSQSSHKQYETDE
jgi:hypothetical protein